MLTASDGDTQKQRIGYKVGRLRWLILAIVAGMAATALAYSAGSARTASRSQQETVAAVDVGFLQDMIVHHEQAVEMALIALSASKDPAVRALAGDVVTSQQSQIGMMQGWLRLWKQPITPTLLPMHWMSGAKAPEPGHPISDLGGTSSTVVLMPGMANASEIRSLREASGEDFDNRFLQLLLRHHEGGLPMARYAAAQATIPVVTWLAQNIVVGQSAEVAALNRMLADRKVSPLPVG